jgi:hypothetical protein
MRELSALHDIRDPNQGGNGCRHLAPRSVHESKKESNAGGNSFKLARLLENGL